MNSESENNNPLSMEMLRARLEHNRRHYTEKDPANITLGVFADAALKALESMPFFRQNLEDTIALRPDLTPSHAVKLLERCYQATLMNEDPEYPNGYQDTSTWLDAFKSINDGDGSEMLYLRLLTHTVQSNIAERYKTFKILAHLYGDRFGTAPSHLDVGSSVLHGSKKLAFNRATDPQIVPFGDIRVNRAMTDTEIKHFEHEGLEPIRDRVSTQLANVALRQAVPFGRMMGVDISNVDDPRIKEWVKSNVYPDELLDKQKTREYEELDRLDTRHERIRFERVDFSSTGDVRSLRKTIGEEQFDIITFSTIFYQVSQAERTAMLVNAAFFLSDQGIIVVQDAPDGNFETPYNYRVSIRDGAMPELGDQEILRWKTPRCREAMIGLGKLSIHGKLLRMDEALQEVVS